MRLEQRGVTPQGVALVSAVIAYLFAKPGSNSRHAAHYHLVLSNPAYWDDKEIWVAAKLQLPSLAGVLAGAIDYYILDKFQRLTNTKTYTKVHIASANLLYASPCI